MQALAEHAYAFWRNGGKPDARTIMRAQSTDPSIPLGEGTGASIPLRGTLSLCALVEGYEGALSLHEQVFVVSEIS